MSAEITAEFYAEQYAEHFMRTIKIVCSRGADFDLSEDIAQTAWLKAWGARNSFNGDCSFSSWVGCIAINEFRTYWRNRKRRPDANRVGIEQACNVVVKTDRLDDKMQVEHILHILPDTECTMLREQYWEGLRWFESPILSGLCRETCNTKRMRLRIKLQLMARRRKI